MYAPTWLDWTKEVEERESAGDGIHPTSVKRKEGPCALSTQVGIWRAKRALSVEIFVTFIGNTITSGASRAEARQAWLALQQARVSVEKLLRNLLAEHSHEIKEQCRMYRMLFKETKKPR